MLQRHLFRLSSAIVLSGLLNCAQAVELGEPLVRSHIGQPLSADIELAGIAAEAVSVQAALANPDVYRGANIAMHPALSSLNITIVRRDGRRFLHIASPKVVESEYVHIFFELTENGRHSVRQATLWFTPDPHPPAPPKPAPVVLPVQTAVPAAPIGVPAKAPGAPIAPPRIVAAPVVLPRMRAAPAAACVQQFTAAQIGTCAALDARNAQLNVQIVELEEKVGRLTLAMQERVRPAAAAAPAALKPIPAARKPARATPWLLIGLASAAAFALVGVLVYFLRRKRKAATVRPAAKAKAGFIASVKNRLLRVKKEAEAPIKVEPAAE